jgi:acetylornithine aminotransferase
MVADIVRAENCYLWDAGGRRYIDLESGVWCTSIGHSHPAVTRILSDQSGRVGRHRGLPGGLAAVADRA